MTVQQDLRETSVLDLLTELGPRWSTPGHSIADGMPIGNGNLACLAWVDPSGDLRLRAALNDSWDENARSIGLSNFRVHLDGTPFATASFEQRLDYARGRILITGGDPHVEVAIWADAGHSTIHLEVASATPQTVVVTSERWRTETVFPTETQWQDYIHVANAVFEDWPGTEVVLSEDQVVDVPDAIAFYHRNETSCWPATAANQSVPVEQTVDPYTHRTSGAVVRGTGLVSATAEKLVSTAPATQVRIDITASTMICDSALEWIDRAISTSSALLDRSTEELRSGHEEYWREFWTRSYLFASGSEEAEQATRGWVAARYLMAIQGRSEGAIEFNGGVFTFNDDHKLWHDYTQYNQRFAYWSMLTSGDLDLMDAYFRVASGAIPVARAKSLAMWGHDGVMLPEHMIFGGFQSGSHYGWDRTGLAADDLRDKYTRRLYSATPEIAVMMLDRYAHAPDREFATSTLLPFAGGVVEWYDRHWQREAGTLVMEPVYSGEMDRDIRNPAVEVAALSRLLRGLLELPVDLTSDADRARWTRLLDELPALPIEGGRIRTSEDVALGMDTNNQNLYPVFPFRLYGEGQPDAEIAEQTYLDRRGKSGADGFEVWRWDAIAAAYLGLTDEAARHTVRAFTHEPYRYEGFVDGDPDGDHAIERPAIGKTALQAMVLRPVGEQLRAFAAWPPEWSVQFRLWGPSETVVEGTYRPGSTPEVSVEPAARRADLVVVDLGPILAPRDRIRLALVGTTLVVGVDALGEIRLQERESGDEGQSWEMGDDVSAWTLTSTGPEPVVLTGADSGGNRATSWRVERVVDGSVVLRDASDDDRCLTAASSDPSAGLLLAPRASSARQRFTVAIG